MISPRNTFALGAIFAAMLFAAASTARAQDDTVVLGGVGSNVRVDLSVLDDLERGAYQGEDLRFPGAPENGVQLQPPGSRPLLKQPRKKVAKRKAPAKKKAAPQVAAGAPAPETPAGPPKEATGAPRPVTEAPGSVTEAPTAPSGAADRAPPPAPEMDRTAVPPPAPPPPPAAPVASSPDVPPVTPAPRRPVDAAGAPPPPPPPPVVQAPQQTAALPKAPELPPGAASAVRAIAFGPGTANLPADAEGALKATVAELNANPALRVQLRAYAAGDKGSESQARRLSLSRALAVRSFLVNQGIQATRIDVRALGNNVPEGSPDRVDVSLVSR